MDSVIAAFEADASSWPEPDGELFDAEAVARVVLLYYALLGAVLVATTVQTNPALKGAVEWGLLVSMIFGALAKRMKD